MNNQFQPPEQWGWQHQVDQLDILKDICHFVELNRAKMAFLAEMEGGWEAWLQAELAYFFITNHSTYLPTRELAVYHDPSQRIDLWCRRSATTPMPNQWGSIGIELKCEGMWQDTMRDTQQTPATFYNRVMQDVNKVCAGVDTRAHGPCTVYIVAITTSVSDVQQNFRFRGPIPGQQRPRFKYWASSPTGTMHAPAFYVIWFPISFR
jgi:hypothetical protein